VSCDIAALGGHVSVDPPRCIAPCIPGLLHHAMSIGRKSPKRRQYCPASMACPMLFLAWFPQ
jgi:hypothetical protein